MRVSKQDDSQIQIYFILTKLYGTNTIAYDRNVNFTLTLKLSHQQFKEELIEGIQTPIITLFLQLFNLLLYLNNDKLRAKKQTLMGVFLRQQQGQVYDCSTLMSLKLLEVTPNKYGTEEHFRFLVQQPQCNYQGGQITT